MGPQAGTKRQQRLLLGARVDRKWRQEWHKLVVARNVLSLCWRSTDCLLRPCHRSRVIQVDLWEAQIHTSAGVQTTEQLYKFSKLPFVQMDESDWFSAKDHRFPSNISMYHLFCNPISDIIYLEVKTFLNQVNSILNSQ